MVFHLSLVGKERINHGHIWSKPFRAKAETRPKVQASLGSVRSRKEAMWLEPREPRKRRDSGTQTEVKGLTTLGPVVPSEELGSFVLNIKEDHYQVLNLEVAR